MNTRRFSIAVLIFAVTTFLTPLASAITKTTDSSDLWWIHTESGWGIQLVQNHNTIFATLFAYGPDNQPIWYTATLIYEGSSVWSGTLYKTTGPWFGAGVFDPSTVTVVAVGTMTVTATSIATATLTYTVNGVAVTKAIERELLALENFAGIYAAVFGQQAGTGTGCNAAAVFDSLPASVAITQSATAMTLTIDANGDTCSFTGAYSQTGHFGRAFGNYTCTSGASGTFDFFEMVRTHADFRARTSITRGGCTIKGRMVGLEQPLPPQ